MQVYTTSDEGWIKLHRKSIHSQVFQSEGLWKLWTWCLLKANHGDRWVSIRTGKGTSEIFVKRGQFVFGRKTASKELKMKPRTVHYRILKLATMRNLDIQSDSHYSIVTILNYDTYQSKPLEDTRGTLTGNGQANDTNKNYKNEKNNITGRSKSGTDPRVKEFLRYWGNTFLQETGQPYPFSYEKDARLAKDLLRLYSLETLQDITRAYFRDEWSKGRGFDFGLFRKQVGRLISLKTMNPLEQAKREIERQA